MEEDGHDYKTIRQGLRWKMPKKVICHTSDSSGVVASCNYCLRVVRLVLVTSQQPENTVYYCPFCGSKRIGDRIDTPDDHRKEVEDSAKKGFSS